jgi:hypothetical protein
VVDVIDVVVVVRFNNTVFPHCLISRPDFATNECVKRVVEELP